MFNKWKLEMKKFTLFNNKWHPIRFIFWIFSTKNVLHDMKLTLGNCKMQANVAFLSIMVIWACSCLYNDAACPVEQCSFFKSASKRFRSLFYSTHEKGDPHLRIPLFHSVIVANESLPMNWLPLVGQQVVDQC